MHSTIDSIAPYIKVKLQNSAPIAILKHQTSEIEELPIGTKFKAVISSVNTSSSITLESSFGKLSLQTRLSSLKGDILSLQLISKGSQLQLLIMSVNGKSPNHFNLKERIPTIDIPLNENSIKNASLNHNFDSEKNINLGVKLMKGMRTSITVLNTVMLSPSLKNVPNNNKNITTFSNSTSNHAKLNDQVFPSDYSLKHNLTSEKKNTKEINSDINKSLNSSPHTKAQSPNLPVPNKENLIPVGTRFLIVVRNIVPSLELSPLGGLPLNSPTALNKGVTLTGVVVGKQGVNQSIVQTHAGPLAINTQAPLPIGTTIDFEIVERLPILSDQPNEITKNKSGLIIRETNEWKTLNEAIISIGKINPIVAQQAINSAIPKLDSTFTSTLLLFIAVIRNSDFLSLFGDAPIRILQRTRPNLLLRLREDFQQIAQLSDNTESDNWRTYPIPIMNGEKIEQIRLFMRRNNNKSSKNENSDIRFLIDIKLKTIGRCQLDGLVNKGNKKFDLVVRTEMNLSNRIENKIKCIFTEISNISGITGKVDFNFSPPNFIKIHKNELKTAESGIFI